MRLSTLGFMLTLTLVLLAAALAAQAQPGKVPDCDLARLCRMGVFKRRRTGGDYQDRTAVSPDVG